MTVPPEPSRPPLGAVVNYTLFGSGSDNVDSARLESLAGSFETRIFGSFGLIQNDFMQQFYGNPDMVRLNSDYIYEDPERLRTWQVGDLI